MIFTKTAKLAGLTLAALWLVCSSMASAAPFSLGSAGQFVILGDSLTYEVGNNSQIVGNIGVGPGGRLKLSGGPFDLTGNIYFADPVVPGTNYITSGTNNISGSVSQNNALVTGALSDLNTVYSTALGVLGATLGTLNSTQTIGPGNYTYTKIDLNSDTITFNGSASDYIIINVLGELKINHSSVSVTGTIPIDHILWNLVKGTDGGDNTKNVTVSGADTEFVGVFLALDRKVSLGDDDGVGRFFGGKSTQNDDDFRFVSGVTLSQPPPAPVPEPTSLLLLGLGMFGLKLLVRRHRT